MPLRIEDSIQPRDLAKYDGPLFVKSNTRKLISFDDRKGNELTLTKKGTDDDFAQLDRAIADNVGFQRAWRRGDVLVFKDGAASEELNEQERRLRAAQIKREEEALTLEKPLDHADMNDAKCLECGTPVFQTAQQIGAVPPLCEDHEASEGFWSPTVTRDDEGNSVTTWTAVKIDNTPL